MSDTDHSTSPHPEGGRAFDPDKPFTTRDGQVVQILSDQPSLDARFMGSVADISYAKYWNSEGKCVGGGGYCLDLVNTPSSVSSGGDRPGQADAAVAEAERAAKEHAFCGDLTSREIRMVRAAAEAALRAVQPGEQNDGWRAGMETAAKIVDGERLEDPQDESDRSYNVALDHAIDALRIALPPVAPSEEPASAFVDRMERDWISDRADRVRLIALARNAICEPSDWRAATAQAQTAVDAARAPTDAAPAPEQEVVTVKVQVCYRTETETVVKPIGATDSHLIGIPHGDVAPAPGHDGESDGLARRTPPNPPASVAWAGRGKLTDAQANAIGEALDPEWNIRDSEDRERRKEWIVEALHAAAPTTGAAL